MHRRFFFILLIPILFCAWPCALYSTGLTPHDVARIRTVTAASISPDGRLAAFTVSVPRLPGVDEDGRAWSELHVYELESGRQRPFVTGQVNVADLDWTPDSQTILFLAKRTGDETRSLYGISVAGGEAQRLVSLSTDIDSYAVGTGAEGSARIALLAEQQPPKEVRDLRKAGFGQRIYEEDWLPKRLWITDLQGRDPELRKLPGSAVRVAWNPAPGSDILAVSVVPRALVDDVYMRQRVLLLSPDSQIEVNRQGKLEQIAWSPGGSRLALISGKDLHDPHAGRVALVDASDGSLSWPEPEDLTSVTGLTWLGEQHLGLLEAAGVRTQFRTLSLPDSRLETRIPLDGPVISRLSFTRDGSRGIAVASSPEHPPELYEVISGRTQLKRLTNSNPWLGQFRLSPQEVVRYRARDGLELEGILIPPLNRVAGQPFPLIVSVHGGPEAHVSNGWLTTYSLPGQAAAARGMGVFYPNYRGSTGRGVAFAKLGQGDAAGREFDDLVDGVDHLIAAGLVDTRRVGVTGGSYGGYATAWCSTYYSDRFAAGVMFVGISNKISKFGTTDIADEEYYVHARKRPWEDWQMMLERSPIFHGERHRTPLLILHGADDPRVNVGQSRELFRHLSVRGQAPVRLVLYPGEPHGNQKAAARLDYSLRMLQWMEHYLLGPGGEPPAAELDYDLDRFTEPSS